MAEKEMTFWDHLEALRWMIFRSGAAVLVIAVVLFFFKDFLFDGVILAPTRSDFFVYRFFGTDTSLTLINTEVAAQFMVHMKVCAIAGLVLGFPVILFEIWKFIAPALYENEKRSVRGAFLFASLLFYVGVAVGYVVVLPLMVNFFDGYSISGSITNMISLSSYIATFAGTVLVFGIVFEFPTVVAVLSTFGILTREMLEKGWRYAVLVVIVLAALITPSGDPVSLSIVSLPLFLLYGFSIIICKKKTSVE
ncbi:MAG: twin-arginine translocase subunit TatC [Bacteroidales bacterium]|nr:twin-arginine translocase subunit TatC [Candidatus Cryptobacteroides caccocaballi]